jgi:hypothetical protein
MLDETSCRRPGTHRHTQECAECFDLAQTAARLNSEAEARASLDARYAAQLNLTIKANSTIEDLREELHAAHEHRRVVEEYMVAQDPAPLDVERLARALPQVMTQEECDEVYAVGTNPLDVPYEWFTTPRELATDILSALEEPTPCRCVTWNGVRQPTFGCPVHSYDIEYAGRAALEEPTP